MTLTRGEPASTRPARIGEDVSIQEVFEMLRRLCENLRKTDTRRLALRGVVWLLALTVASVISALTAKLVDAMW
ncbi:hypothetical protein [Streptomyces sp. A1547]|uniref:hypothetical protein n=1 Tax=Streptomyces sp. A1547 TaxID=2563105 RepID=UPI00109EB12C|nr:hypothetical protein [Streptomyces sp. A1547]THA33687.1 hypothetical protein E6W17_30745 [Streptomyces sp. A1547]